MLLLLSGGVLLWVLRNFLPHRTNLSYFTFQTYTADHTNRAKDKQHKLRQLSPTEKYLFKCRNNVLIISNINEGKKMDHFVDALKYNVQVKVMKSSYSSFEKCTRTVFTIDSAIWRAEEGPPGSYYNDMEQRPPIPMKIRNLAYRSLSKAQREQHRKICPTGIAFSAIIQDVVLGNIIFLELIM